MKVRDVMTKLPAYCSPETTVAVAAEILWNHDCGILPIADSDNKKMIGLVTDRDLCIALGTQDRRPSEMQIKEIAMRPVSACKPDDDLKKALASLAEHRVRRLPVIDNDGTLQGILGLRDIVLHRQAGGFNRDAEPSFEEIVNVLASIFKESPREARQRTAAA